MMHHKPSRHPLLASLRCVLTEMRHPARLSALGLGALAPLAALANPTGGQVVGGSATISTPSANGTVINQGSQRAVINWQQFSVGANQYVQFVQPSSSAVVLNRVIGSNPSSIFGNITANGQVFLVNPNGILFAPGATLDVAGLVASTLDVSDADFMQGNYVFSRGASATPAVVQNQGSIVAGSGGYVVLAGDYVENDGHIDAQSGRVYLAAGNSATLTFDKNQLISYTVNGATLARLAGVVNTGEITADGGAVVMTADVGNALIATAVNNSGFVAARSIRNESGVIVLAAEGGGLVNSGTLDASAAQAGVAGGTVLVRGNEKTELAPTSVIDAGGDGAQGGFVELSGHHLAVHGDVNLGHGGNLLLDPAKLFITAGNSPGGSITSGDFVGAQFIDGQLTAGANVVLVASNSIAAGNPGGVASGPATAITALTGTGNLTIKTGTLSLHSGTAGHGSLMNIGIGTLAHCGNGVCKPYGSAATLSEIFAATSGTINLSGVTINIKGAFTANASQGNVTLGPVKAKAVAITGGKINLSGNVTASAGTLAINAHRGPASAAAVTATTGTVLTGKTVTVNASGSYGGKITLGDVMATGGSIIIHADDTSLVSNSAAITAGNLTGKTVTMQVFGPNKSVLNVGAINAEDINISASGKSDTGVTGAITAVSATGQAAVLITQTDTGGANTLTVNGGITVSGKQPAKICNGSICHPNPLGPDDLPLAAELGVFLKGTNTAHKVKVAGPINVSAAPGTFSASSKNEGGPVHIRSQSGTGGEAKMAFVVTGSLGSASIAGSVNAKGPDAHVDVLAHSVTVGNVTVTGSGHNISRTITNNPSGNGAYTSHNSAGQAVLRLGAGQFQGSSSPVTVLSGSVKAGAITVSGKGVADARLFASNVSAGDIKVTATAAKGSVTQHGNVIGSVRCGSDNCNSAAFYAGLGHAVLKNGSIGSGRATISVGGGTSFGGGSSGAQALNVKFGALNISGVGEAAILLDAKAVTTQALSAVATKGTEKGTGSSQSGGTTVNTFARSFNINGGGADIKIRSGGSGSHGSGVLTQNGGPVNIGGTITVTGPTANVDVKGKSIKIGGTVTVTGSGGSSTEKTVFTPATGTGYTTSFNGVGPTGLNLQGAISGSVSVAGKTTIKGQGLVGVIAVGQAVKLHGFSGSAAAVKHYSVLDTRVSPTAVNFTAGSLAVIVSDVGASGGKPVFASGVDTGDMKFSAKGNVDLATRLNVGGTVIVEAVGSIFGTSHGVVAHFNSIDAAHPHANSGGGHGGPKPGVLPASALQANAMAMVAGKGITLTGTQLNIGTGSISSVHGDSTLIAVLATEGLAPASANPNGAFIAGGAVTLGDLQLTGSYLLLQGSAVSVLGKVTAPKGTLVQVEPFDLTLPIDIEDSTLLKSVLGSAALTDASGATSFGLTNSSFLSLFPGDTIAVGGTGEAGVVTIGANGPLDIGDTNLIIYTTGDITGLGTITSTGIVQSLLSVLGPAVPPVTAGEVDPTAGSGTNTGLGDQTDKRKIGGGGDQGGDNQPAGTVSQDTGNASVCH